MPAKRLAIQPVWLELTARLDVISALDGPKINSLAGSRFEPRKPNLTNRETSRACLKAARTIEGQDR